MTKALWLISLLFLSLSAVLVSASDRDEDLSRIQNATRVFQEIISTPDNGIPNEILPV